MKMLDRIERCLREKALTFSFKPLPRSRASDRIRALGKVGALLPRVISLRDGENWKDAKRHRIGHSPVILPFVPAMLFFQLDGLRPSSMTARGELWRQSHQPRKGPDIVRLAAQGESSCSRSSGESDDNRLQTETAGRGAKQ